MRTCWSENTKKTLKVFGRDAVRLLAVGALVCVACGSLSDDVSGIGRAWLVIKVSDVYIVLLLVTAALQSNDAYPKAEWLTKLTSFTNDWIMPTRFAALLIVPGLFAAIWMGFASLYLHSDGETLPNTTLDALLFAFSGFSSPGENLTVEADKRAAIWQLCNGLLLLVVIFALLVNRLSEWNEPQLPSTPPLPTPATATARAQR